MNKDIRAALHDERGIALITTLLVMMLMSALMIGFTAAVTSDQKYRIIDRDRGRAFYGAHSGLEKLNSELATLFFQDLSSEIIQDDAFQRLLTFPNVLVTGHQAFFTHEAMTAIADTTLANITAFERGESLVNAVGAELVKPS